MKAHTTGTAGEIFAAKAERHPAGVREHPNVGAEVGAPAPDFAGELARAFVPESALSATVPVPAAMTRSLDPVATRADRESHDSAPVADESSQTKMPSALPSRPVPSASPSRPVVSGPLSRPRERARERADLASAAPVVLRAPADRPERTANTQADSSEDAITAHEAPSTEIPAHAASAPSIAAAVAAAPISLNHEPIVLGKHEPLDSPRTPEPDPSSAEATAQPAIPLDTVPVDVPAPLRAHGLAPAAEHALPTALAAPRAASPVTAHLDPPASAPVAPAASAPVGPADSAPVAPAAFARIARADAAPVARPGFAFVAPATSPPATAPVAANRPHASREPQPLRHVTARPLPRAPISTNAAIPNHAERTLDPATPAALHEPDSHPVTASSPPVRRPLAVEHEPSKLANEATTVAIEPPTESVPAVRAPSQADAPHASRVAAHDPSVGRPATVERESTKEVGPDPQAPPVGETPVLIAPPPVVAASVAAPVPLAPAPLPLAPAPLHSLPAAPDSPPVRVPVAAARRELSTSAQQILRDAPSNSRAAAIVRGHSARASYSREQPTMDTSPAIAPRSSHVEAAPPRTADFAPSAANIPTTIVAGSAVATAIVGHAPVLFSPTVVGGPPAAFDPRSRPRERVRERADLASGGARRAADPLTLTLTPAGTTRSIPAVTMPTAPPSPAPAVPLRAPVRPVRRDLTDDAAASRGEAPLDRSASSPVATPPVAAASPTTPVAAASTANAATAVTSAFAPRRPTAAPDAAPIAGDRAAEDTAARAPKHAPSTDLPVQARASEKAPPAITAENFTKVFGTPPAGDKSESPTPPQVHAATLIGNAPAASVPPHRATFDRAATPPLHATAPASQSPAHLAPSSRRERSTAGDAAAAIATPHAPLADRAPVPTPHLVPHALAPAPFDAVLASLPPPAPLPPASSALMAHAAEDPSLRATVMPERAVLSIDTGGAGELALHLRVKDGVADVRVSGAAAHSVEMRPAELRAALASEGLTLGSFQSGQPAPEHNRGPERAEDDAAVRAPSATAPASSATTTNDSSPALTRRGFHVTA